MRKNTINRHIRSVIDFAYGLFFRTCEETGRKLSALKVIVVAHLRAEARLFLGILRVKSCETHK